MGSKERRIRQKKAIRRKILDTAREFFIKEGYERVSMRRIAEKIEYSPTTIYLYFNNKADLLQCLCEETFFKLIKRFEILRKEFKNPLDCLKKSMRAYIDFGLKYPNHYRITFIISHPECNKNQYPYVSEIGMKAFNFLSKTVEECIQQKKFSRADGEMVSQILWITVHGVTSLLITHTNFSWVDKNVLIENVINTAIEGLKANNIR